LGVVYVILAPTYALRYSLSVIQDTSKLDATSLVIQDSSTKLDAESELHFTYSFYSLVLFSIVIQTSGLLVLFSIIYRQMVSYK